MKKILTLLLTIILCLGLCGCGTEFTDPDYNTTIKKSEYFKTEIVEHTNTGYVIRDIETNVLYIIIDGYSGTMIVPLYNADGSLKLYKGE